MTLRRKHFKTWAVLCFLAIACLQTNAMAQRKVADEDQDAPTASPYQSPPQHLWFSYFQLNTLFAIQNQNAYQFTGEISWNPTVCFSDLFCLRGNIGVSPFKNQNISNQTFFVTDYELFTAFYVDKGFIELGGGVQDWPGNGNFIPVIGGNIAWPFRKLAFGFLDRVFVGYTACFSTYETTHEVKFGIGVAF